MTGQKKNDELIIHILTHGTHDKKQEGESDYDGPLTEESISALKDIEIPAHERVYRGMMRRHKETAEALGLPAKILITDAVGDDVNMLAALDINSEDKDRAMLLFEAFIQKLKDEGFKEVLIITSRFYPVLLQYINRGGAEKLGPFSTFLNIVEDMAEWEGNEIPLMVSGRVSTFTV